METFSTLLATLRGGEFPAQRPVTRSFDVFFELRLNKSLSKQSWGWWFETLSDPLWRHCNELHEIWSAETYNTTHDIYAYDLCFLGSLFLRYNNKVYDMISNFIHRFIWGVITLIKFWLKLQYFHRLKCICKYLQWKVSHFVSARLWVKYLAGGQSHEVWPNLSFFELSCCRQDIDYCEQISAISQLLST